MNRRKFLLLNQSAAVAAFTPTSITGLQLWLKADTGVFQDAAGTTAATADAHPVGLWKDQSGNGYDVSQSSDALRPILKLAANGINGRATVLFNGSSQFLLRTVANWLSSDSAGSIFAVVRLGAVLKSNNMVLGSADEAGSTKYFEVNVVYDQTSGKFIETGQINGDTADANRGSTVIAGNTVYLCSWRSSGTANFLSVNGSTETITTRSGANNGDWFADTADRDNFTIGALKYSSVNYYFKGDIAEVLVYNSNLAGDNLTNVRTYLNTRYAAY